MVPTSYFLVLSAVLFGLGVIAFIFKRNIITIFMSIELMLNAVNLAFVTFSRALGQLQGQVFVFLRDRRGRGRSRRGPGDYHPDSSQPGNAQRGTRGFAQRLMPVLTYLWIIPLLPLLGAAANGIFGGRWPKRAS